MRPFFSSAKASKRTLVNLLAKLVKKSDICKFTIVRFH